MVSQLKILDLKAKSFTANGTEYFIEGSLSFNRFLMFQTLEIEAGYQAGFYKVFEALKKIYEYCNGMKFADIAVLSHNTMAGIKQIEDRKIPFLSICALFINSKDEDRRIINDAIIDKKIADWEAEGMDIVPFLKLAANFIPNFLTAYEEVSQTFSETQERINQKSMLKKQS